MTGKKNLYDIGSRIPFDCGGSGFPLKEASIQNKEAERDILAGYMIGARKVKGF